MWVTQGEFGIQLRFTVYRRGVVEDLTGLTGTLRLRDPSGALQTLTLTAINLAQGLVGYTPPSSAIFASAGVYRYELRFVNGGGTIDFRTKPSTIMVERNV